MKQQKKGARRARPLASKSAPREKDPFFDAEPGALVCSCPCGCTLTNADAGMFENATEATLAAMGGEIEHPSDFPVGPVVCERCFCGNWPQRCGKPTYVSFEEAWDRAQREIAAGTSAASEAPNV